MRLSEQILLGRHLVEKPEGGSLDMCALGMGMKAEGIPIYCGIRQLGFLRSENYEGLRLAWQWLMTEVPEHVLLCGHNTANLALADYEDCIIHLFDDHVDEGNMTLEQLCDYVRSVEPEEAPEQAEVFAENRTEKIAAGDTRRQG